MNAEGCTNGPSSGEATTKPSKSSNRNQRRRRNKKNAKQDGKESSEETPSTSHPAEPTQNETPQNTPANDTVKKLSNGNEKENQNNQPQRDSKNEVRKNSSSEKDTSRSQEEGEPKKKQSGDQQMKSTKGDTSKSEKQNSSTKEVEAKSKHQEGQGAAEAQQVDSGKTKSQLKAERRAQFEAERAAKLAEQKEGAASGEGAGKSKSETKADRRAKQEAQRAAKAEQQKTQGKQPQQPKKQVVEEKGPQKTANGTKKVVEKKKEAASSGRPVRRKSECIDDEGRAVSGSYHSEEVVRVPSELRHDDPQQVKKKVKRLERQKIFQREETHKKVALFSHLKQYQIENGVLPDAWKAGSSQVHPAFYRVGIQIAYGTIIGANNRCMALAEALTAFVESFQRPEDKEFGRYMESKFSPNITFLSECRPLSAGMRTLVKAFKSKIVMVGRDDYPSDEQRKEELKKWLVDFIQEKIVLAGKTISKNAAGKISSGSCLLTFAFSSTVAQVFRHAHEEENLDFTVIVADCEPLFEGRRMIRFLENAGIACEYVSLTGVASVMSRVSALFIGAQAIFNNGSVLARAGTGLVASIAEEFHRPLHVCCESYKFWERVQLDSFVYNDLGDPTQIIGEGMRDEWENTKCPLHYLNPLYDVTPPELIDVVVTELCLMPSSSVPVVLRRHAI